MTPLHDALVSPRTAPLFARYLLAGLGSFVTDFSLFALLAYVMKVDALVAHPVSRTAGGLACFALNRRFTFRSQGRVGDELGRFAIVFFASLALTEALLALFERALGIEKTAAKALAEGVALLFNFVALRRFAFLRRAIGAAPAGDVRAPDQDPGEAR